MHISVSLLSPFDDELGPFLLMLGRFFLFGGCTSTICECLIENQRVTNHPVTLAFTAALTHVFIEPNRHVPISKDSKLDISRGGEKTRLIAVESKLFDGAA